MNKDFLDELRKLALYFKLEVGPKYGGAIDVDSLTKVLKGLNASFQSYFDAELRNLYTGKGKKITAQVDKEIRALKEEAKLLVVDLKFASFEAAISPDSITTSAYAHIENPLQTKKKIFQTYENDIFYSNLNDARAVEKLERKFSREERSAIFKPLEETIFHPTRYSFKFGKSFKDLHRTFKPLKPEFEKKLIPSLPKQQQQEAFYKIYVVNEGEMDLFGPKPKIKKIMATEKLERPVYPLQLASIKDDGTEVIFKQPITAEVTYDEQEDLFYISYAALDIMVWDKERSEADAAFQFTLLALIQNYYNEEDANLTKKAREIKRRLSELIEKIK